MSEKKFKFLHYVNQFYGQIGGEDKAGQHPVIKPGPIGPGIALEKFFEGRAEIIATIICGDNYFAENQESTAKEILTLVNKYKFDGLIAGPAFSSGRYGIGCGTICAKLREKLKIPVVTAMFPENPAVELFKKDVFILKTGASVSSMRSIIPNLSKFLIRLAGGEKIGSPDDEGYIPQGYKVNVWDKERGATRAINMLLKKMKGESFITEASVPKFDSIVPAAPFSKLSEAVIALVTSGGIVPKGNPDHIRASNADKFAKYSIAGLDTFVSDEYESAHAGYDVVYANNDPNRVLPLDAVRQFEREGIIGKLFDYYYATVGNLTTVSNAMQFGYDIGNELKKSGVDGVILTST